MIQLGGCAQPREALRLVVGLHWIGLLGTDGAAASRGERLHISRLASPQPPDHSRNMHRKAKIFLTPFAVFHIILVRSFFLLGSGGRGFLLGMPRVFLPCALGQPEFLEQRRVVGRKRR